MNYEYRESRADLILLLIKKDTIKNASVRTGQVLNAHYIIKQDVFCSLIPILETLTGSGASQELSGEPGVI